MNQILIYFGNLVEKNNALKGNLNKSLKNRKIFGSNLKHVLKVTYLKLINFRNKLKENRNNMAVQTGKNSTLNASHGSLHTKDRVLSNIERKTNKSPITIYPTLNKNIKKSLKKITFPKGSHSSSNPYRHNYESAKQGNFKI